MKQTAILLHILFFITFSAEAQQKFSFGPRFGKYWQESTNVHLLDSIFISNNDNISKQYIGIFADYRINNVIGVYGGFL